MKTFLDSKQFRRFTRERDYYLEQILFNAQRDLSSLLAQYLDRITQIATGRYASIPKDGFQTLFANKIYSQIDLLIADLANDMSFQILHRIMRLRRSTYALTLASEFEAVAQVQGKQKSSHIPTTHLDEIMSDKNPSNEDLLSRVRLELNKIKRDAMNAIELSKTMDENVYEMRDRLIATFPRARTLKKTPKVLKDPNQFAEADSKPKQTFSNTFMNEDEWAQIVDDYKGTVLPEYRFENDPIFMGGVPEGEVVYNWEIENQVTHDFVSDVRDGKHEAFKQAGVKDFIWVAILDKATDECCEWRSGLTISEIETQLEGKHADDECRATVPPAHFNCRCDIAPVGEVPEQEPVDYAGFDSWLNS